MSANVKLIWSDLVLALKGASGAQGWHFGLHERDALFLWTRGSGYVQAAC